MGMGCTPPPGGRAYEFSAGDVESGIYAFRRFPLPNDCVRPVPFGLPSMSRLEKYHAGSSAGQALIASSDKWVARLRIRSSVQVGMSAIS
jgi:hypothetical protein